MRKLRTRPVILILVTYLALAMGFNAVNPIFEAPDENWHYFTAQTIAETGRLPKIETIPDPWMAQEAAQPPLYYLLASLLIRPIESDQARNLVWENPRVMLGDASSPTNTNAFVHPPNEMWPWEGYVLAVHAVRALSTLIGLGTLLCIFGAGRLVWPNQPERAALATALVAFLPQFLFLHASVTNDVMIILTVSFVLWQLLRMWTFHYSWRNLLVLGLSIGLAILSKTAGLLLLLYSLGFLSILAMRESRSRSKSLPVGKWLVRLALVAGTALFTSGWLLWRNWQLYGDITASNQILSFFGGDRGYSVVQVLAESSGLWNSMIAVFGWFNVRPPGWVFLIWNALVGAAVLGILLTLTRRLTMPTTRSQGEKMFNSSLVGAWLERRWFPAILLGIWVLAVYAALVRFMMQIHAGQGRLLFPALLPLALGLAYGLSRYRLSWLNKLAPLLALSTSVYCLLVVIPQANARPPIIEETEIPIDASPIEFELIPGLELVAAQIETEVAEPGERIWATLYWRKTGKIPSTGIQDAPQMVVELLGRENRVEGKYQSYHGGGLFPATLWKSGDLIADKVAILLSEQALVPAQLRLNVKIAGAETAADVGTVKIVPESWPTPSGNYLAEIDGIYLLAAGLSEISVEPGDEITVILRWWVERAPGRNLTTFVHLGDRSQPPLSQGDSPPLGGHYPATLWATGEVFDDSYRLAIPDNLSAGRYPVHVGLYESESGRRLPLIVSDNRQPNDAYQVGNVTVSP